jgi:hypothetical protein
MRALTLGLVPLSVRSPYLRLRPRQLQRNSVGREIGTRRRKAGTEIAIPAMATVDTTDHPCITARNTMTRTIILHIRTTTLLLPITGQASASRLGSKLCSTQTTDCDSS